MRYLSSEVTAIQHKDALSPSSGGGLTDYWYPVCRSSAVPRGKPQSLMLFGTPLVIFRGEDGIATALLDRCPHRNVPLSIGHVLNNGRLRCAYHGWEFCADGSCAHIPGRLASVPARFGHVAHYVTEERHGLVWVYAAAEKQPARSLSALLTDPPAGRYIQLLRELQVAAAVFPTVENALDVPHTAFLHRGLFRGTRSHRLCATVTRYSDRVVTQFEGEPRPSGLVAKLLSPSGGLVEHSDRFILPLTVEVEYKIGTENHFLVTAYCTPVNDHVTRLFARISYRTRAFGWLLRWVLEAVGMRIFRQDANILRRQHYNQLQLGGEHYLNTELDLMGPHIRRLLKEADTRTLTSDIVTERKVEFDA